MLKSTLPRKFLSCLMFGLAMNGSVWVFAQDGGDRRFDRSDFDGPPEGMGRDRGFGDRGFGGRGEFRRFGGGDFGGGEGRFRGGPGGWGGGEGRWGGGEGRWGGGDGPGSEENRSPSQTASESTPAAPTSMRPKERVSIVLPEAYVEGDRDKDGQIGLYEWRQWRRGDMVSFLALDHNGDGFLTPAELVKGPRTPNLSSVASTTESPPASAGSSPTGGTEMVSTSTPSAATASGTSAPNVAVAASKFGLLDANRNGQVDPEEWSRSRTIKPQFEGAKIDLSKTMAKDDFIKHYLELNPGK